MSVLQVTGLTVEFGQHGGARLRAVDDLSCTLRAGQALALVGESGSGKSTVVRALATDPDVLLADETVSMLDVSIRLEILHLLDRLKRDRNLAMLYVTHDLATARHFSSEIMVMYRGQIVEHGPADEVILRPAHPYTQILASAAPDLGASRQALADARQQRQAARAARTAELRETALGPGCRFRSRCPHAMPVGQTSPPGATAGPGHRALCWLYDPAAQAGAA